MWQNLRNGVNVQQTNVVKILGKPSPLQIMIDRKQLYNVEHFDCLCSIINAATCTREIKSGMPMTKAAFTKQKTLFTNKLDLNQRNN